ncbi:hypothetical protein DOTSEDRAFT_68235 [Dothistroma septosporum NZE10]|uniref:Transcription factor BYE1 n=1 Tax=Dothistroma septosporum (strain NZE10 / CBS 128990) TaxID=675120 RepID=N1Q2B0_DOTSN|nr:hypothetical protein DOTSEDRAFT_68235 [Dothistroma septosporum NZE10]
MADEPRRSGRATKGQHKNASSSPAPQPKPAKGAGSGAGAGAAKGKPGKKAAQNEPSPAAQEDDNEEEEIRCICGNANPNDKRPFIGCDSCEVWQHNVCMGITDDEDDIPEHYFCEKCSPDDHQETLQALERGEKIWESRNKLWQNEKKMSKNRKSKNRGGDDGKPAWLKKDVPPPSEASAEEPAPTPLIANGGRESGKKRKREEDEVKEEEQAEPESVAEVEAEAKPSKSARQDKRRKSTPAESKMIMTADPDSDTALVSIKELPKERQSVAQALSKIIGADIEKRAKSGSKLPTGQTGTSLGEYYAVRIEYSLHMNHGAGQEPYKQQFRTLHANLKKNTGLIEKLMLGSLTPDELSTMDSSEMLSEDKQRERASMKEALDRQAVAVQEDGPRYKQDHKGYHLIEGDAIQQTTGPSEPRPAPSRASASQDAAGRPSSSRSPTHQGPLSIDTKQTEAELERRASNQNFSMDKIWEKTGNAQSPTANTSRPLQRHARRTSSIQAQPQTQGNGAKDDPDIDRMLEDNDDTYSPAPITGADSIIWRGKLIQTHENNAPTVNARFVAGRDLASTVPWQDLLPHKLSIDGRLAIAKAEEYLCGLRWSSTSDVAVLALTPYDNAQLFNDVFEYFHSRQRYAVIENDKPYMVKDFYIIPLQAGAELPPHISMLEHCTIKQPIEERMLLATLIVARAPSSPSKQDSTLGNAMGTNGNHLPPHVRQSIGGPAGSPLTAQTPTFPPQQGSPQAGYGASAPSPFPPNPYGPSQPTPPGQVAAYPAPNVPSQHSQVEQILGELQYTPTAKMILSQAPLSVDQLNNLRTILVEDLNARTDFEALTRKLFADRS